MWTDFAPEISLSLFVASLLKAQKRGPLLLTGLYFAMWSWLRVSSFS